MDLSGPYAFGRDGRLDMGQHRHCAGQLSCFVRHHPAEAPQEVDGDCDVCCLCAVHRCHLSTLTSGLLIRRITIITFEVVDTASRLPDRHRQWQEAGKYCQPLPSRIWRLDSCWQTFRLSLVSC